MNIAFIVFNRPAFTARVFEEIARARPDRLFIIADAPRADRPADAGRVAEVRAIVERIDWPCKVDRHYASANMGCRRRVTSGLDWVFSQVEEAIILEDDCLPDPTFFTFCGEMLNRYRDDTRIMHISGSNFDPWRRWSRGSYQFSIYPSVWGWATWRRAWSHYDDKMTLWPGVKEDQAHHAFFPTLKEAKYFEKLWDDLMSNRIDAWGGRWVFACRAQNALSVRPAFNAVSNVGFGPGADAVHTTFDHWAGHMKREAVRFPLRHPGKLAPNRLSDAYIARSFFRLPSPLNLWVHDKLMNRHCYGSLLRTVPLFGSVWVRLRQWMKHRSVL